VKYAQRHLASDEELVYATRQHWTRLFTEFVLLVLIWLVAGAIVWFLPSAVSFGHIVGYVVAGIATIATVRYWLVPLLAWRGIIYIVTTKRIYKRSGFLTKTGHSIPLSRVNDVSFEATLWERILGEGTVSIQSASEHGMLALKHVPEPEKLKDVIYQAMDEEEHHVQ